MTPRIVGRSGQADDGPHPGKYFYEMRFYAMDGETPFRCGPNGSYICNFGPFENRSKAEEWGKNKMREFQDQFDRLGETFLRGGRIIKPG